MANILLLVVSVLLITTPSEVTSARILGIFSHIGKSHFFVFEPLMQALAARGHDVHVVSHFPQRSPLPNYTDISLEGSFNELEPTGGVSFEQTRGRTMWSEFFGLAQFGIATCEATLSSPQVQKLLHSNDTYDVVISELFNTDCVIGFADKFNAPLISVSSCALMPWANGRFGNPDNPSYISNILEGFSTPTKFKDRLSHTLNYLAIHLMTYHTYTKPSQKIAEKYFSRSMPPVEAIARNTSLMLVNTHPSLNGPRPMVPAIVEVGGLHVQPLKKLPEELDQWLNESRHGVVYFSMGSMLRAETLPADKRAALLEAFAELPQRVLWKWEGDSLPGQPDNVRVAKWLPQRDILNHSNVRVFMTHGGLLGVIEGVMSAVPMVATPIYGDQHLNSKSLEQRGVAVILQYADISKESVLKALRTVLDNPSYQESADRLSREFLDRPTSPMDTAIFWTEYVIRHKGAHHLRSAAVELPWFQYLLLDVALVLLVGGVLLVTLVYVTIRKLVCLCAPKYFNKAKLA